jgi:hypothetical protein
MSTHKITRRYPGKSAAEIFTKVDELIGHFAERHSFDYKKDHAARAGAVSKMGVHGAYACSDGEVSVELKYPMFVPGPARRKVEEDIERRLETLFG